jgi:hypothetical protein
MLKVIPKKPQPGCSAPVWRRQRPYKKLLACVGLVSVAAGWTLTATAGDHFYNFDPPNGDPATSGFILYGANAANAWHTNNGASGTDTDGFLEITPAVNNENLGVLFPLDYFTNADQSLVALPLKGFLIEADVRIGNAVGNNGRPADGFSISFAKSSGQSAFNIADDPVIYWGKQANFRGWAGGDADTQALEPSSFNYATGGGAMDPTVCDSGTAENGTKTGVSVQFDTWAGNRIINQNGQADADNVGWRVHFNGKMLERIVVSQITASPDGSPGNNLNGLAVCPAIDSTFDQDPSCTALVCADTNTIQTGIYSADSGGDVSNLCWTHFSVELTTNTPHLLTVKFKGRTLVDQLPLTNFSPFVGQLVMGGRTGGANENRDVDNVHIVTFPAVQAVFNGISSSSAFLQDFTLTLQNIGPAKVTTINSLLLDGTDIKAAAGTTITLGDPISTVKYVAPGPFPSGTAHAVAITFTDAAGTTQTQTVGFTVLPYFYLPASAAVPAASIDTAQTGFRVISYQTTASQPNRMYWTDEQLLGLHGTNEIDYAAAGVPLVNGEIQWADVVDFGNSSTPSGEFPTDRGWGGLGIPALTLPNDNNSSASFMAYLYFPTAGTYVMGGNSDDGLRVTFAQNSHDLLGTQVPGLFADFGRGIGADQNVGAIIVTNAGYYGFRMLWENGGGGSAVEWYFKSTPAGITNILVNDVLNNPQAIKAYQVSSAAPPYVSYAEPPLNDDQFLANTTIQYKLTDASTTVNSGSVTLAINGTAQTPTVSASGGVTTITQPAPASLWTAGSNWVQLSFKDSGNTTYNYAYSFTVPPFATLDASQSVPLGKQDSTKPGFVLHVTSMDFGQVGQTGFGMPNQSDNAIGVASGLFFPYFGSNAANVLNTFGTNVAATASNEWDWTGTILWNANGPANSVGDYPAASYALVPGIPGAFVSSNLGANQYNNYAVMIQTWVAFPTAGFYQMDFNSDDGFRIWEGWGPSRQVLHVSGTGVDMDVGCTVNAGGVNGNAGFTAPPPPVVPISAPVVVLDTNTPLSSIAGKIAAFPTTLFGLGSGPLAYFAQTNGAVAAIIIDQAGFPGTGGTAPPGQLTIPTIRVASFNGAANWTTAANLTASIGASQRIIVGEADYGKGRSEIVSGFNVPAAGVYPISAIYYQGGGGAGAEWTTITADGNRHLLNDTTDTSSLLAYRAVTQIVIPPPTLSVGKQGNSWVLTYTGTLYSSSTVNGTYGPVAGASSPYTIPSNTAIQFYRAHQ